MFEELKKILQNLSTRTFDSYFGFGEQNRSYNAGD